MGRFLLLWLTCTLHISLFLVLHIFHHLILLISFYFSLFHLIPSHFLFYPFYFALLCSTWLPFFNLSILCTSFYFTFIFIFMLSYFILFYLFHLLHIFSYFILLSFSLFLIFWSLHIFLLLFYSTFRLANTFTDWTYPLECIYNFLFLVPFEHWALYVFTSFYLWFWALFGFGSV